MRTRVKVLRKLLVDGRINLIDIAKELGISHVAVRKHYLKLLRDKVLTVKGLVNVKKLGFKLLQLKIEIPDPDNLNSFMEVYSKCPRMLALYVVPGEFNVYGVMIAEDENVRESMMTICTIRKFKGIRRIDLKPILLSSIEFTALNLPETVLDKAPCSADCGNCTRYKEEKCIGCPATKWYRGVL